MQYCLTLSPGFLVKLLTLVPQSCPAECCSSDCELAQCRGSPYVRDPPRGTGAKITIKSPVRQFLLSCHSSSNVEPNLPEPRSRTLRSLHLNIKGTHLKLPLGIRDSNGPGSVVIGLMAEKGLELACRICKEHHCTSHTPAHPGRSSKIFLGITGGDGENCEGRKY